MVFGGIRIGWLVGAPYRVLFDSCWLYTENKLYKRSRSMLVYKPNDYFGAIDLQSVE